MRLMASLEGAIIDYARLIPLLLMERTGFVDWPLVIRTAPILTRITPNAELLEWLDRRALVLLSEERWGLILLARALSHHGRPHG